MRNNGIANPQRQFINYPPVIDRYVADPYAPSQDDTLNHLDRLEAASAGFGFPVGRPLNHWPPTRKEASQLGLRRVWP